MHAHGMTHEDDFSKYTDVDGDAVEISATDDNDARPAVALSLDAGGNVVHVDAVHVEDVVAALRQKSVEARMRYGTWDSDAVAPSSVLQELTEVFAEGGHGDSADRHALDLLARYRAELAAEQAVANSL